MVVTELTKTCDACPAQWEGRTEDGGWVYVRFRWGGLRVGFGPTLDAAVDDERIFKATDNAWLGVLSYDDLCAMVPEVTWPAREVRP